MSAWSGCTATTELVGIVIAPGWPRLLMWWWRHVMDHDSLYETDICTWAEQQAAALRGLASRTDLPNQLDLPNIIEEIEDVGSNHLSAVGSYILQILSHVVRAWADPDAQSMSHWTGEVAGFHADLMLRYTPSMRQRIDMALLWSRALRVARAKLEQYHSDIEAPAIRRTIVLATGPCPLIVDDICDEAFAFRAAVQRLDDRLSAVSS